VSETSPSATLALASIRALQDAGFRAYLVGGCVRDRLLGMQPHDYDVATNATPAQLTALFPGAIETGISFGVIRLRREEGELQLATFRQEGAYSDGRRPDAVSFVTEATADAARRDFTINAMFEDPVSGELLDPFGGQQDLQAGLIRAVGDASRRFEEDHLRMVRAVRFAARYRFQIEEATAAAIQAQAHRITRIAPERLRDEIARILVEGAPRRGFELLDELGLLEHLMPEVKAMQGVEQPPEFHPEGDVWIHTMLMLEGLQQPTLTVALGVLFHDIGKPVTQTRTDRIRFHGHVEAGETIARDILRRFRFSGEQTEQVLALVRNHMKFIHLCDMRESTRKRFLRMPRFEEHLELHRVDCLSSHRNLDNYHAARDMLAALEEEALRPRPLLNGNDLVALGYPRGPLYREILTALEDEQLEGNLTTKEQALAWLQQHYPVQQG
jgi:tRNA nucleotidyltransferase/poly(A) polymerase